MSQKTIGAIGFVSLFVVGARSTTKTVGGLMAKDFDTSLGMKLDRADLLLGNVFKALDKNGATDQTTTSVLKAFCDYVRSLEATYYEIKFKVPAGPQPESDKK